MPLAARLALRSLAVTLCSGCASVTSRSGEHEPHNSIYLGVREDIYIVQTGELIYSAHGDLPRFIGALDLPLSAVADTAFLPFDLFRLAQANPP
jgi:uncharacterized protein YceK